MAACVIQWLLVCARVQGFPDWYRFHGSVPKQVGKTSGPTGRGQNASVIARHQQIGNSVSPVVAKALGAQLLLAHQKSTQAGDCHPASPQAQPSKQANATNEASANDRAITAAMQED